MKTAKDILASLQDQPRFSKLRLVRCQNAILSLFLPALRRFVAFSYIKNDTLFVALLHNAGKQEFDNSIKMIKDLLKLKNLPECEGIAINDIKAFVTHKPRPKPLQILRTASIPHYKERSNGNFSVSFYHDKKLQTLARQIKEIIKTRIEDAS